MMPDTPGESAVQAAEHHGRDRQQGQRRTPKPVTASFGVAWVSERRDDFDRLQSTADAAPSTAQEQRPQPGRGRGIRLFRTLPLHSRNLRQKSPSIRERTTRLPSGGICLVWRGARINSAASRIASSPFRTACSRVWLDRPRAEPARLRKARFETPRRSSTFGCQGLSSTRAGRASARTHVAIEGKGEGGRIGLAAQFSTGRAA